MARSTPESSPPGRTPGASGPSPGLHARSVASTGAPTAEDLEIARADALLQLRIGRSAHYYAILVSAALVLDAVAVLWFPPRLLARSWTPQNLYFLFVPVLGGLCLAIFGLALKWDEFQLWPWERHFWVTVLAVFLAVAATYLLVAGLVGFGPTADWSLVPGLLPLAFGGLSAAMAGLALTWPSASRRQLASLASALVPIPLGFVLFDGALPFSRPIGLALALMISGFFLQTSGSWLHLISSGTRAHEREMITSGQTRMFVVADELGRRERSLQLREATVLQKETEADVLALSARRRAEAADEQRARVDRMEEEIRTRSEALAEEQRAWALRSAEVAQAQSAVADKEADLALRETTLAARAPVLADREERLRRQEEQLVLREAEANRRTDELARREAAIRSGEGQLEVRRADIEHRTAALLEQEARLRSRETLATAQEQDRTTMAAHLADLDGRETRLRQLEISLTELQERIRHQTDANTASAAALTAREEQAGRTAAALLTKESALTQREREAEAATKAAEAAKRQYEEAIERAAARGVELDARSAELDRRLAQLQSREQAVAESTQQLDRETRLEAERAKALDRRERELKDQMRAIVEGGAAAPADAPDRPGAAEAREGPPSPEGRRAPDRQSIGVRRLDDLLLGGLPPKGHVLFLGPPFLGKETLLYQFMAEGLRRGETVVAVAAARPAGETADALRAIVPDLTTYEASGRLLWIDASGGSKEGATAGAGASASGSRGSAELLAAVVAAARKAEANGPGTFRVAVAGLGHLLRTRPESDAGILFQNLVGILKPRDALAAYTLDPGLLPAPLLQLVTTRTDGVIEFKEDRGRTLLAVRGLGEVESRDWVEYRQAPGGLVMGSFSLERIR